MITLAKRDAGDVPRDRLIAQIDLSEAAIGERFAEMVAWLKARNDVEEIERAIANGAFDVVADVDPAARVFAAEINARFAASASDVLASMSSQTSLALHYDVTNYAAIQAMQANTLEVVQSIREESRDLARTILSEGIAAGDNPRVIATTVHNTIGLTTYDHEIIANYRRALETADAHALTYELRDLRFDRRVDAAARGGRRLSQEQIDRAVARYSANRLDHRQEVVARTEALSSVHEGVDAGIDQAVATGALEADAIIAEWLAGHPPRTRFWHASMNGQRRAYGEPFLSGQGNPLRYPGDRAAPADERANCRCQKVIRVR